MQFNELKTTASPSQLCKWITGVLILFIVVMFMDATPGLTSSNKTQPSVSASNKVNHLSLKVQKGEIGLTGNVVSIELPRQVIVIDAKSCRTQNQTSVEINPSKQKDVVINELALMSKNNAAAQKLDLSNIKEGDQIFVIGKNPGTGKPITARLISITVTEKIITPEKEPDVAVLLNDLWKDKEIPVQGTLDPRFETSEKIILDTMRNFDIPGAVLAVSRRNPQTKKFEIIVSRGYGYMDKDLKVPTSPNAIGRLASVQKVTTQTAIRFLIKEGWQIKTPEGEITITLDTPIFRALWYLGDRPPEGTKIDPRLWKITIGQVIEHRGGITDVCDFSWQVAKDSSLSRQPTKSECTQWLFSHCPTYEPGTDQKYTNDGYWLLSRLIDLVVKDQYPNGIFGFMKDRLFGPYADEFIESSMRAKDKDPKEMYYWSSAKCKSTLPEDNGEMKSAAYGWHNGTVYIEACSAPAFANYISTLCASSAEPLLDPATGDLAAGVSNGFGAFCGGMSGTMAHEFLVGYAYLSVVVIYNRGPEKSPNEECDPLGLIAKDLQSREWLSKDPN